MYCSCSLESYVHEPLLEAPMWMPKPKRRWFSTAARNLFRSAAPTLETRVLSTALMTQNQALAIKGLIKRHSQDRLDDRGQLSGAPSGMDKMDRTTTTRRPGMGVGVAVGAAGAEAAKRSTSASAVLRAAARTSTRQPLSTTSPNAPAISSKKMHNHGLKPALPARAATYALSQSTSTSTTSTSSRNPHSITEHPSDPSSLAARTDSDAASSNSSSMSTSGSQGNIKVVVRCRYRRSKQVAIARVG